MRKREEKRRRDQSQGEEDVEEALPWYDTIQNQKAFMTL